MFTYIKYVNNKTETNLFINGGDNMIQKDLKEVIKILDLNIHKLIQNYNIKLIYIFGSYSMGKNNSHSDLDIALLLEEDFDPLQKLNLIGDLCSIFKRNDIDLVIMNSANPVLCHQIIKYGRLVYIQSEDVKVGFEVKVLSEYLDTEYLRRTQMHYINEWVKEQIGG